MVELVARLCYLFSVPFASTMLSCCAAFFALTLHDVTHLFSPTCVISSLLAADEAKKSPFVNIKAHRFVSLSARLLYALNLDLLCFCQCTSGLTVMVLKLSS